MSTAILHLRNQRGRQNGHALCKTRDMESYYILRNDGHWKLLADGLPRALGIFDSKEEALDAIAGFLGGRGASLTIYKPNGDIEEERHYSEAEEVPARAA